MQHSNFCNRYSQNISNSFWYIYQLRWSPCTCDRRHRWAPIYKSVIANMREQTSKHTICLASCSALVASDDRF